MLAAIPQSNEYLYYADAHWRELIDRYEPCVLWNDIGYPAAADLDGLFTAYLERVPDGVINNRFDWVRQSGGQVHTDFLTPEYSTEGAPGRKWESTRGIGTSFGYNRQERDEDYLSVDDLVRMLVEVVSHGGNLLLNVGPSGDGTIPPVQAQRLLGLGWWLRTNGEGIFGTRPWSTAEGTTGEGLDVRFTRRGDSLYAIVLGTPASESLRLPDVNPRDDAVVELLGRPDTLAWTRGGNGIGVQLAGRPPTGPAITLRVTPAPAEVP
jgi:alpha-L-fucosidase